MLSGTPHRGAARDHPALRTPDDAGARGDAPRMPGVGTSGTSVSDPPSHPPRHVAPDPFPPPPQRHTAVAWPAGTSLAPQDPIPTASALPARSTANGAAPSGAAGNPVGSRQSATSASAAGPGTTALPPSAPHAWLQPCGHRCSVGLGQRGPIASQPDANCCHVPGFDGPLTAEVHMIGGVAHGWGG